MGRFIALLLVVLPLFSVSAKPGWKLVWAEEFDVPGKPDPKVWNYEKGFVRNQEPQYYTEDNVVVRDGCLVITAKKEKVPNQAYDPKAPKKDWKKSREFAEYTSSSITTARKREVFYGRVEVRAKCPKGSGMWPAIWTIGTAATKPKDSAEFKGWPACGEIDIMEYAGKTPDETTGCIHVARTSKALNAEHFCPQAGALDRTPTGGKIRPYDGFHIYALEWDEQQIRILYDEILVLKMPLKKANTPDGWNALRHPHFVLLNLALGTNFGGPIDQKALPAEFLVDYVRYYVKQ